MNKVLAIIEEGEQDVVKVVTVIGHACSNAEKLLTDSAKLAPEVKQSILTLIDDGEQIATAVTAAALADGENWMADTAAVVAVKQLVSDFIKAGPILKQAAFIIGKDIVSTS